MAIFYCQTAPLGRSAGRSAVAAAAYRSGAELVDERTGLVHDYTRRSGVESADLVLPAGGAALDRGALWNRAEAAEARKDARTAREWVLALPDELGQAERKALALEFARELADRYGVAVDVAIHRPGREGDQRNHHAHLLATTRQLGPDGFGAKADIELSDKARAARGLGPGRGEIESVRATWAALANGYLERAGQDARIDHRSLKAQGIEREPTRKLGPAATAIERRTGGKSERRQGHETGAAERQAAAELKRAIEQEAAEVAAELADLARVRAELEERQAQAQARRQRHRDEVAEIQARQGRPAPAAEPREPEAPTPTGKGRRQDFGQAPPKAGERGPGRPDQAAPARRSVAERRAQETQARERKILERIKPEQAPEMRTQLVSEYRDQEKTRINRAAGRIDKARKGLDARDQAHEQNPPSRARMLIGGYAKAKAGYEAEGEALARRRRDLDRRSEVVRQYADPQPAHQRAVGAIKRDYPEIDKRATKELADRTAKRVKEIEQKKERERERDGPGRGRGRGGRGR